MALEFHFSPITGGTLEVHLTGELVLGPHLRRFGEQTLDAIAKRKPSLLALDLTAVTAADSAGLGELVVLFTAAADHHCRLALIAPPPRVQSLLVTTRLDGLIPVFPTVADAGRVHGIYR